MPIQSLSLDTPVSMVVGRAYAVPPSATRVYTDFGSATLLQGNLDYSVTTPVTITGNSAPIGGKFLVNNGPGVVDVVLKRN